jgi:hypothetical protein
MKSEGKSIRARAMLFATLNLQLATAATVVGDLKDISIQALDTKIMFAPTNEVLVTPSGLSAGPPKVTESVNGAFSIVLEAGDYTVSLPLIPWRHGFQISVMDTNGIVNITNLLSGPQTYTYTNNLNYTVKATSNDFGPDFLDNKLRVTGGLTKTLATNAGVITVVLSGGSAPVHVNTSQVTVWSTNGESTLLDGAVTLGAGALAAGKVIRIDGYGWFDDPSSGGPSLTLNVKLGSTVVATQTRTGGGATWHLSGAVTVRSAGMSGTVVGAVGLAHDNSGMELWGYPTQTATVNTTGSLGLGITGSIQDVTGAERMVCEELVVIVE